MDSRFIWIEQIFPSRPSNGRKRRRKSKAWTKRPKATGGCWAKRKKRLCIEPIIARLLPNFLINQVAICSIFWAKSAPHFRNRRLARSVWMDPGALLLVHLDVPLRENLRLRRIAWVFLTLAKTCSAETPNRPPNEPHSGLELRMGLWTHGLETSHLEDASEPFYCLSRRWVTFCFNKAAKLWVC